jgi:type IV secretory pathway VirB3-like protein
MGAFRGDAAVTPVCCALTRPKLIHGVEWRMYYLIMLGCMVDTFLALWSPTRLLLLPIIYFGPYTFFRWAGRHDPQWAEVYPLALRNRTIFFAQSDPRLRETAPPRRVLLRLPKFNA